MPRVRADRRRFRNYSLGVLYEDSVERSLLESSPLPVPASYFAAGDSFGRTGLLGDVCVTAQGLCFGTGPLITSM